MVGLCVQEAESAVIPRVHGIHLAVVEIPEAIDWLCVVWIQMNFFFSCQIQIVHINCAIISTTMQPLPNRYRNQATDSSLENTRTFHLLLDLMTFFDFFHGGKLEQAYSVSSGHLPPTKSQSSLHED